MSGRVHVATAVALYLLWIGFSCGGLVLGLGGLLPFGWGTIPEERAFLGLVQLEIFFVLFVWPTFIPRLLMKADGGAPRPESPLLLLQVGLLLVVALPAALVSTNLSDAGASRFLAGHLMVGALACFVTALFAAAGGARFRAAYYLGVFTASAFLPFLQWVLVDVGNGPGLPFLASISPFWAAAQLVPDAPLAWAPSAHAAIFGVLGVAMLAAAPLRAVAPPSTE